MSTFCQQKSESVHGFFIQTIPLIYKIIYIIIIKQNNTSPLKTGDCMLYQDRDTLEVKTKRQWLASLRKGAECNHGDGYDVSSEDLFKAMVDDGILYEI